MKTEVPSPIGTLIVEARKRAPKTGNPYVVHSKTCTCEVEVAYFSATSTRERFSRCAEHRTH